MAQDERSLGSKIAVGTLWSVGMRWGTRLMGLVSTLVLARLLVPEDFGVIAKAALIYEMLNLVTAFGLETALITDQNADREKYNTVWTIHLLRGFVIAVLLLAAAYPVAAFFDEPALTAIVPCYALVSILIGAVNIGTVDFRKHFRFDLEFRLLLIRKVAGFLTTISIAAAYQTYWAFVAGTVADALAAVIASYVLSSHRVQPNLVRWREFVSFGSWMMVTEWLSALSTKLDTILLSRLSSTSTLGLYTVSYEIAATPSSELAMPVARALMPGLSKLTGQREEHQRLYASTMSLVLTIAVPAAVGLAILAHLIVPVVLGSKWIDAVPFLQALALFGITRAVTALSASAFLSFGRADLMAASSVINLAARLVLLTAGMLLFGAIGLAWAVVAAGGMSVVTLLVIQQRVGILNPSLLLRRLWRVLVGVAVMIITVHYADAWMASLGYVQAVRLVVGVGLGATVFAVVTMGLWQLSGRGEGPESIVSGYLKATLAPAAR